MQVGDEPLQHVPQAGVLALRVDADDVLGDVVDGEVLEVGDLVLGGVHLVTLQRDGGSSSSNSRNNISNERYINNRKYQQLISPRRTASPQSAEDAGVEFADCTAELPLCEN